MQLAQNDPGDGPGPPLTPPPPLAITSVGLERRARPQQWGSRARRLQYWGRGPAEQARRARRAATAATSRRHPARVPPGALAGRPRALPRRRRPPRAPPLGPTRARPAMGRLQRAALRQSPRAPPPRPLAAQRWRGPAAPPAGALAQRAGLVHLHLVQRSARLRPGQPHEQALRPRRRATAQGCRPARRRPPPSRLPRLPSCPTLRHGGPWTARRAPCGRPTPSGCASPSRHRSTAALRASIPCCVGGSVPGCMWSALPSLRGGPHGVPARHTAQGAVDSAVSTVP